MKYMKTNLLLMVSLILETVSMFLLYFYGAELWSLALFLIGALLAIVVITGTETRKNEHVYVLLSIILGFLFMGIFVFVFISDSLLLLNVLNYAVCFIVLSMLSSEKIKKVPKILPDIKMKGEIKNKIMSEDNQELEVFDFDDTEKRKTKNEDVKIDKKIESEKLIVAIKEKDVFHISNCYIIDDVAKSGLERFSNRTQAMARGLRPCKVCKP